MPNTERIKELYKEIHELEEEDEKESENYVKGKLKGFKVLSFNGETTEKYRVCVGFKDKNYCGFNFFYPSKEISYYNMYHEVMKDMKDLDFEEYKFIKDVVKALGWEDE